jgi:hypothetical protein
MAGTRIYPFGLKSARNYSKAVFNGFSFVVADESALLLENGMLMRP